VIQLGSQQPQPFQIEVRAGSRPLKLAFEAGGFTI
jgi:hypothetical protein